MACWNERIDRRHPDVEPDDADGGAGWRAALARVSTRTNIVGRLPTVAGCPASGRRSTRRRRLSRCPSSNISDARRALRAAHAVLDHPPDLDLPQPLRHRVRQPRPAARRPASHRSTAAAIPGRTPAAAAAPPFGSTCVTSSSAPTRRTSKPGSPLRSTGRRCAVSRPDGNQREVRQAEAAEHVADDVAQLAGRSAPRRARPELRPDRLPVDAVHRRDRNASRG